MAIVKGKFIVGLVGPIVYKMHRGQQVITARPRSGHKITAETKQAAHTFGKASGFASQIRQSVSDIVTKNYDGTMNYRLNQELVLILKKARDPETGAFYFDPFSFEALRGFQFNSKSPFNHSLFVNPYITVSDGQLSLHLPEISVPQDMKFPLQATSCNINFEVVEFNVVEGKKKKTLLGTKAIAHAIGVTPAQEWTAALTPGWFSVVVMSLNYVEHTYAGDVVLNSKTYCPAMMIQAGFLNDTDQIGPFALFTDQYR
jgi:hypothetical protein